VRLNYIRSRGETFCPYVCANELASECFPVYCEINGMLEHV